MKWSDYFFSMIFVIVIAASFFILIPAYTDYRNARTKNQQLEQQLLRQELQAHQLRRDIQALKNDPVAIERVAREKLGWCREDEMVYHFETAAPPATGE